MFRQELFPPATETLDGSRDVIVHAQLVGDTKGDQEALDVEKVPESNVESRDIFDMSGFKVLEGSSSLMNFQDQGESLAVLGGSNRVGLALSPTRLLL